MKRVGLVMALGFLLYLISPVANAFDLFGNLFKGKNTCNELMREHRVGRFSIDIPVEAKLHYRQDRFDGAKITVVEWNRNISINTAFEQEWDRRIVQIKAMDRHRNVDSVLVEERTLNDSAGDIKTVLYYGNSSNDDTLYWDLLLKTDRELVWFSDTGMQEFHEYVLENLLELARAYRSGLDEPPPDAFPWFSLDRGLMRIPFKGEEETELRFVDHPLFNDLKIRIETNHVPEKSKSLLKAYSWYYLLVYKLGVGLDIRKLRTSRRTLAGMKGEEVVVRVREKDKPAIISFEWSYRGEKDSMERPEINIAMESEDGDIDKKMALWEQMLASFHFLGTMASASRPVVEKAVATRNDWSNTTAAGLVIYRSNNSYGLRNAQGLDILRPEYRYIGEFQDGMLLVMKTEGSERSMGLLDRHGKALTPIKYSRIGFFKDGLSIVESSRDGKDVATVIDLSGREITREKFRWIKPFKNGFATIRNNNGQGYGFINRRGERITNTWYEWVEDFREGRAIVRSSAGHGIIDERGLEIVTPQYSGITNFSEGRSVVKSNGGNNGYVNKDGKLITPVKYEYAESFSQGVARVTIGARHGLVDREGKEITPVHFDSKESNREGLPLLFSLKHRDGAVDLHGKTVIPFHYRQLFRLDKDLIRAILDDSWGVLDERGNIVVPIKYRGIHLLKNGLLKVQGPTPDQERGGVGLLARDGRTLVDPEYDEIEEFGPNLIRVVMRGKQGLFDLAGNVVVPARYDRIMEAESGLLKVENAGRFGMLDLRGREIVPIQYDDDFRLFDGGNWIRVHSGGKYGFYNSGLLVIPVQYDYLYRFDDDRFIFRSGDLWGFLDGSGREVIAPRYQYIGGYRQGVVRARLDGKWGYLDTNGGKVVPFQYDFASDFVANRAYVKEHKQWKVIGLPTITK